MKTCEYLQVKPYEWRGLLQTRGLRKKAKRVLSQFTPHDFTAFTWAGTTSSVHYITVVFLLAMFLAAELNPFYLKVCISLKVELFSLCLELLSDIAIGRVYFGWNPTILW